MLCVKNYFLAALFAVTVFIAGPLFASAAVGVGVGTGKIIVDEPLKPGLIYTLPTLSVLNTGDEAGDYGVSIEYHEGQEARADMGFKPAEGWFTFEPANFHLEPGTSQTVQIRLNLPVNGIRPGQYFAYLEGHPVQATVAGQTRVGIAAAAKLYFTVEPANFIAGVYYRVMSLFALYAPWSYVGLAIVAAGVLIALFRRFFSFNLGISFKKK